MKHEKCPSNYTHSAHSLLDPDAKVTVQCPGLTAYEAADMAGAGKSWAPTTSTTINVNASPKPPTLGLEKCKLVRVNKEEGVVIQVDGIDYTLEDVTNVDMDINANPPEVVLTILAPKMEIYIP